MNDEFPPNVNPTMFSLSAIIIALILQDELNANEMNAIGNWLQLLGQFIETTSAQRQLISSRTTQQQSSASNNSNLGCTDKNNHSSNNNSCSNNQYFNYDHNNNQSDLELIYRTIKRIEEELEVLKNK